MVPAFDGGGVGGGICVWGLGREGCKPGGEMRGRDKGFSWR